MMYSAGLIAVIKCNGQILREDKDIVNLPFNSEYSILLKNLESRKAQVQISIDGTDVLDGNSLILNPNSETELEGFMKDLRGKNKFKFIQKTKEISDYRGDRVDDGIIRVEYTFEKIIQKQEVITEHYHYWDCCNNDCWNCISLNGCPKYCPKPRRSYTYYNPTIYNSSPKNTSESFGVSDVTYSARISNNLSSSESFTSNFFVNSTQPSNDEGITVKGSEINQQFNYANIGILEDQSRVIILKLRGSETRTDGSIKNIKIPITVKTKLRCSTCGKVSKSNVKFCSKCGSFLE